MEAAHCSLGAEEGAIGREIAFGEGLWSGALKRSLADTPPWQGPNFRAVCLGPALSGRQPVLIVLGGSIDRTRYQNCVWRSLDGGVTWEEASPNEDGRHKWCGRQGFAAAGGWAEESGSLRSLVYVVGGLGPAAALDDVWATEDLGRSFRCMCAEAPFGRRVGSGLAVCPRCPQRLVLVGGEWGNAPSRWDCWLSEDAGANWTEVQTPENTLQRRQPTLLFPCSGTLVVLGGHVMGQPCHEAHVAKVLWQRSTALWWPMQLAFAKEQQPLEELSWERLPWFLSHGTAYDRRTGEFIGLTAQMELAVGRLPPRLLLGPLERTPGKTRNFQSAITTCPARLPGMDAEPLGSRELVNAWLFEAWGIRHKSPCHMWQRQRQVPELHLLLPADALRLFLISAEGVWSASGYRRQLRLLERVGQQLQQRHGLLPEVWHRVLLALLGGRRVPAAPARPQQPEVKSAASGQKQQAHPELLVVAPELAVELAAEPDHKYFIVGTWDSFKPSSMLWDGSSFVHFVVIGPQGWESFQILQDGQWHMALYPSTPDGNPFTKHVLMGPDAEGHGKNWTIGRHPKDQGPRGCCYRVELVLRRHSKRPGRVEWTNVGVGVEAEVARAKTMGRVRSAAQPQPANVGAAFAPPPQPVPEPVLDLREPLLLVGTCNSWNVELAKADFRFKRAGGGVGSLESRLIVRTLTEQIDFQVISAKRLWDWRLCPSREGVGELRREERLEAQLFAGVDHGALHGRNFRIKKKFDDKVYVMVSLSASDGLRLWYS